MKTTDIPQFISTGSWCCHYGWDDLEAGLDRFRSAYGLDLDPSFQRAHVWTEDKQIAYVEYCLRGGTQSREILFNCPMHAGYNNHRGIPFGVAKSPREVVIVDGKQRLEAVRRFMRGELPAFGKTLFEYEPLTRYRDGRPDRYVGVMEPCFAFRMATIGTMRELLELYLQINSGGVVHTDEELERVREMIGAVEANDEIGG